ncbi:hypothetical protein BH11MYX2_BH11MYX2_01390 [soil metagenome]
MLVVAVLDLERTMLSEFRAYEHKVADIMRRHGGVFERAIELDGPEPDEVRELHILRFPDAAALEAYRADPDYIKLAADREACVRATALYPALDLPPY